MSKDEKKIPTNQSSDDNDNSMKMVQTAPVIIKSEFSCKQSKDKPKDEK